MDPVNAQHQKRKNENPSPENKNPKRRKSDVGLGIYTNELLALMREDLEVTNAPTFQPTTKEYFARTILDGQDADALLALEEITESDTFSDRELKVLASKRQKDHLDLELLFDLGKVYERQGKRQQAMDCYDLALHHSESSLGFQHPSTLEIIDNMAVAFRNQGNFKKSIEFYGRSLKGQASTLGKDHPCTKDTVHTITDVCDDLLTSQPDPPSFQEFTSLPSLRRLRRAGTSKGQASTPLRKDHTSVMDTVLTMVDVCDDLHNMIFAKQF